MALFYLVSLVGQSVDRLARMQDPVATNLYLLLYYGHPRVWDMVLSPNLVRQSEQIWPRHMAETAKRCANTNHPHPKCVGFKTMFQC